MLSIYSQAQRGTLEPTVYDGWVFALYKELGNGWCLAVCPYNIYSVTYFFGLDELESPTHLNLVFSRIKAVASDP